MSTGWALVLGLAIGAAMVATLVVAWALLAAASHADDQSERWAADQEEDGRVSLAEHLLGSGHVRTIQPDELDDTEKEGEQDEHRK